MDQLISIGVTAETVGDHGGIDKATSWRFPTPFARLWTIEDTSIVCFRQFTGTAPAQRAVREPNR